ncbi:MAG: 16S rRNA (cytidine(1402)-2'-O)-methyltransferase [Verrucomicrobiales bacterium]|nr:16S rRNA (cytidine(1402)-2'-O)-methyltransferase [Verrucomicrobiales bacterium]
MSTGKVSLIASPIGNLGDITIRAIECLRQADLIACEDTRHSRKLLAHYEIDGKELVSCHDHNEARRAEEIAGRAANGARVSLLTDAGTPSVSDPGYRVVNACRERGVEIEILPGASAVLTALVGSGFPTDAFYFGGFLPVKSGRKTRVLTESIERAETSLFFESPHRIAKTANVLADLAPEREICVARELTKKFEEFLRGPAPDVAAELNSRDAVKGEITLLIRGSGGRKRTDRVDSANEPC